MWVKGRYKNDSKIIPKTAQRIFRISSLSMMT
jgi:hypothetical protein